MQGKPLPLAGTPRGSAHGLKTGLSCRQAAFAIQITQWHDQHVDLAVIFVITFEKTCDQKLNKRNEKGESEELKQTDDVIKKNAIKQGEKRKNKLKACSLA